MNTKTHTAAATLVVIAIPLIAWYLIANRLLVPAWLAVGVLVLLFSCVLGHSATGAWRGILIDARNVISLSRLQMLLWTVVVLSAFLAAAFYNIRTGIDEPLGIAIPEQLWIAMGISVTSLVGTPLLLSQKSEKPPSLVAMAATVNELAAKGENPANTTNVGQIICNVRPKLAQWLDMFTGDETSNGAHIDLAKVQMFFFTLVILFSYAATLWHMFANAQADGITAFPKLDNSMVTLLGISHSGYLINKVVPRP